MNRFKNLIIIIILISFLCVVVVMPVTCVFTTVTGIYCPACGMTRAFLAIFHFHLLEACYQNLFSIPFFIFIVFSTTMIIKDFIQNRFTYIPKDLAFLGRHYLFILILLVISFIFNNLK